VGSEWGKRPEPRLRGDRLILRPNIPIVGFIAVHNVWPPSEALWPSEHKKNILPPIFCKILARAYSPGILDQYAGGKK
jgi:hypothetical protein